MRFSTRMFFLMLFMAWVGASVYHGVSFQSKQQKTSPRRKHKKAEKLLNDKNYNKASVIYEDLLEDSPENPQLNFLLGTCYLNMVSEKEKAIGFLENAINFTGSKNNLPVDYYLTLGKAYHINYQFTKAIKVYDALDRVISPKNFKLREEIDRMIQICKNGIELMQHPVNISITTLGEKINTKFAEHSPGITADESTLIFTSRQNGTGNKRDKDGQFFEDIYMSRFVDGEWTKPHNINTLNTVDHDASIFLSVDGQKLYLYKAGYYSRSEFEGGDIYVSHLIGDSWSTPKKLGHNINSKYKESHISLSADGNTMYFTSDRPGGYGGMDIYVTRKLQNGEWETPRNLGPEVNTPYNEDGPFIHYDGQTLYFSSRGHNTMGGMDIFTSKNINGVWSKAENIGYPVNSTDDDVYYIPTPDGKRAYLSSHRKGSLGRTDIFLIEFPDANANGVFVLKGKVISTNGDPLGHAHISVGRENKTTTLYRPNSETGEFLFVVKAGENHAFEISAEGYRTMYTNLNIPPGYANAQNRCIITLLPLSLKRFDESAYPETFELIDFEKSRLADIEKHIPDVYNPIENEIQEQTEYQNINNHRDVKTEKTILQEPFHTGSRKTHSSETGNRKNTDEIYFTIQVMALNSPVDKEFFNNLDNVTVFEGMDNFTRYTCLKFKDFYDAKKALDAIIRVGYWDAFIQTVVNGQAVDPQIVFHSNPWHTIQVMALRRNRNLEYFNNLNKEKLKIYRGKNGLLHYTYMKFNSNMEANNHLPTIINKGYRDAFTREIKWYNSK